MNAMMPRVEVSVDTSSIQKAVGLALKSTSRKMELLLADTAFYTARYAYEKTPYAEISDIDASLDAVVQTTNKHPKFNEHGTMRVGELQWTRGMMIAVMRTNPNSKYSHVTSNRWPLAKSPYKRGDYRNFEYFRDAAERMKSARHSSTHFLKSGWKPVFLAIKALGLRGRFTPPSNENELNTLELPANTGGIDRGGMGTSSQWFRIENRIGLDSKYPALAAEHNAALMDYGIPALQYAVDKQAQDMKEHNLEKKIGDDMRREWESVPDAPAYQRGFHDSKVRWAEQEAVGEMETSL